MRLVFEKAARKALRSVLPALAEAIIVAMERIADDPFGHHANVTRLKGIKNGFRLRHGDWRVLYLVDPRAQTVTVETVVTRGGAYG